MSVLGNSVTQQAFTPAVDVYSGNGSTVAFTLSRPVASVAQVEAFIENVPQSPADAFTVNGNVITFTSAPPSGSSNIYVRYTSPITQVITPTDGTVSLSSLSSPVMSAISGMGFKNRIINGAMMIDQRNAGASVTNTTSLLYPVDRFAVVGGQASKFTAQRSTTAPAGFINSLLCTSSSSYTVGASEDFTIRQYIEGFNSADLAWGNASATPITLSFWVRSSLTGTFGGSISNAAQDRFYVFSYTISAANTWEQKTITIAGDTAGTWLTDNGLGVRVLWSLGAGATVSGPAGSWGSAYYRNVTGAVSVVGTSGATFYITGVDLRKGSVGAYSNGQNDFDYRPYGTELALCQRYYYKTASSASWATINGYIGFQFKQTMRTAPTMTTSVGTPQGADIDGFQISHNANASVQVTASAEL